MLEMIAALLVCGSLIYHSTCLLLFRKELKALRPLLSSQQAAHVEKKEPKKPPRRANRLSDASKKWLETKGKRAKEVD